MFRKAVKWVCVAVGLFGTWIGTVFLADAVVKYRVPIGLDTLKPVTVIDDRFAYTTGTWVIEGQEHAYPLQTTDIICEKDLRRCIVATATIMSGAHLNIEISTYDITSWEQSRIVYRDDGPKCVHYVYTIDLFTKSVSGARIKRPGVDTSDNLCATLGSELRLSLKSGAEVTRRLRDKAMPWFGDLALAPLKVFQ